MVVTLLGYWGLTTSRLDWLYGPSVNWKAEVEAFLREYRKDKINTENHCHEKNRTVRPH